MIGGWSSAPSHLSSQFFRSAAFGDFCKLFQLASVRHVGERNYQKAWDKQSAFSHLTYKSSLEVQTAFLYRFLEVSYVLIQKNLCGKGLAFRDRDFNLNGLKASQRLREAWANITSWTMRKYVYLLIYFSKEKKNERKEERIQEKTKETKEKKKGL